MTNVNNDALSIRRPERRRQIDALLQSCLHLWVRWRRRSAWRSPLLRSCAPADTHTPSTPAIGGENKAVQVGLCFFCCRFRTRIKNSYTVKTKTQTFAIAEVVTALKKIYEASQTGSFLFQHERCYKLDTGFVLFFRFLFYFIYLFFRNNDHLLCQ